MVVVLAFLTLFRWPGFLAVVGVIYHCLDARIASTNVVVDDKILIFFLSTSTSLPQSDIDHNIQPATTYHVFSDDDDFQPTTSKQNLSTVPTADSDDEVVAG
jgi:hypothetical protein